MLLLVLPGGTGLSKLNNFFGCKAIPFPRSEAINVKGVRDILDRVAKEEQGRSLIGFGGGQDDLAVMAARAVCFAGMHTVY